EIVKGGAHYQEGLQNVHLTKNADGMREVDIVPADDISPAVWSIRVTGDNNEEQRQFLKARTKEATTARKLVFTDYVLASRLIHWLKEHVPVNGEKKLGELNAGGPDAKSQTYNPGISLSPYKDTIDACQPRSPTPG